jgi:hypothetical protein
MGPANLTGHTTGGDSRVNDRDSGPLLITFDCSRLRSEANPAETKATMGGDQVR